MKQTTMFATAFGDSQTRAHTKPRIDIDVVMCDEKEYIEANGCPVVTRCGRTKIFYGFFFVFVCVLRWPGCHWWNQCVRDVHLNSHLTLRCARIRLICTYVIRAKVQFFSPLSYMIHRDDGGNGGTNNGSHRAFQV